MLDGGGLLREFCDECRQRGQRPFLSYRLNDGHHLDTVGTNDRLVTYVSRFYAEHPEYRIGPDPKSWDQRVHNWAVPEVRAHKLAFVREICEGCPELDGLELDFMRHCSLFRLGETTPAERAAIVAGFVREVRTTLDASTPAGRRRWLGARLPCLAAEREKLGTDLRELAAAGLDFANLSAYYYCQQAHDLAACHEQVPGLPLYLEMTHTTAIGASRGRGDSFPFRRTTDAQFATTAELAYSQGAAGVSLFNLELRAPAVANLVGIDLILG